MRRWLAVSLSSLIFLTTLVMAQSSAQKSIELGDMDPKADACTDFFQYSNGTWRAQNPIPASMDRWSRRWQAGEQNKEALKVILDEVAKRKDWPQGSTEQLIGDFYGACNDEARINAQGMKPVEPMLKRIDAMKSLQDVPAVIREMHAAGVNDPFGITSQPDNHDPAKTIADVYANGLGLPDRDYYFKTEKRFLETRAKYKVYMTQIFKLAGYADDAAKQAAESAFAFETKLAEPQLDNVQLRDPQATDHPMTFAQLKALTPNFDWSAYYRQAGIEESDLTVDQPKFMQAVDQELAQGSLADWKIYLKWAVLNNAASLLSQPFVEASFNFYQAYLAGAKEIKPRWKRCVERTDVLLGEALGKKYVEKYFPPAAKGRMQELVKNELLAMGDIIQGLEWMGPETKKKALEKLATFNPKIGYPDKWKDYSKVRISPTDFWANVQAGRRFNIADNLGLIGKPTDRGRWGMTPPTSNAYYNPLLNEIVFPAGILLPPAFSVDNVDAVNYGAIGVVIGHEISHGFDDQGAQYDATGRLKNWWTDEDLKKFQTKTACVVDQFENYFIEPGIRHNGKLVLGESIGDLAGAKIAYLAYQKAQKAHPAKTINGFTPDQQFFIAWGQFRGDEIRPASQRLMIQGDPHPVAKYRVIGPLSNLEAFAKAFSCSEKSAMVRPKEKRCEVW